MSMPLCGTIGTAPPHSCGVMWWPSETTDDGWVEAWHWCAVLRAHEGPHICGGCGDRASPVDPVTVE